jgi:hypothetical protein
MEVTLLKGLINSSKLYHVGAGRAVPIFSKKLPVHVISSEARNLFL